MSTPTPAQPRCPASYLKRSDVARFDNAAYVANRRGDRCGWWLVGGLASHLRDCFWTPRPWLRKDSYAKTYFLNPECVARFGVQSLREAPR